MWYYQIEKGGNHMKTSREELEQYLLTRCEIVALDSKLCQEVTSYMNKKYDIPTGMSMDMIARGKLAEQTEQVLFYLFNGFEKVAGTKKRLDDYYTEIEINNYSSSKWKKDKIKFPLCIKCLQVAEDQWIGKTDTNFFMQLREAQLINYNENAQRTLTKVNTRNGEYYKITLNEIALKSIRTSYQKGYYIPTPITLNISEEVDTDFYYDEESCTLVINSLPYFDISDGYHRYIAMCREHDSNPKFNQPWELRIINFSDNKARQFIFQEDQKTKMKKANSNTMNQRNPANRAVSRLNEDVSFNLYGEINDKGGKISRTGFSTVLEHFYFLDVVNDLKNENLFIKKVVHDIKTKFNYLTDNDEKYLLKKYSYKDIVILLYVFFNTLEDDMDKMDTIISYMINNIDRIDKRKLMISKGITRSLENDLQKLYEEAL